MSLVPEPPFHSIPCGDSDWGLGMCYGTTFVREVVLPAPLEMLLAPGPPLGVQCPWHMPL